jgi:hypothetical protein
MGPKNRETRHNDIAPGSFDWILKQAMALLMKQLDKAKGESWFKLYVGDLKLKLDLIGQSCMIEDQHDFEPDSSTYAFEKLTREQTPKEARRFTEK